jgi:hypothetical protein
MPALRFGYVPSFVPVPVACLGALVFGVQVAGCASQAPSASAPDYVNGSGALLAQATTAAIEADGLPAQTAPLRRIGQEPDDPSQPYSANYGASQISHARSRSSAARLSRADEEALILRAIAEHEMRQQ